MEDRYTLRLIAYLIIVAIYLFMRYPGMTLVFVLFAMAVLVFRMLYIKHGQTTVRLGHTKAETENRESALAAAAMYLAPYDTKKGIWKNLKLSNKFCYIRLTGTGEIVAVEKRKSDSPTYRKFTVINSRVYSMDDLFNMFCASFNHCKYYDDLIDDCRLFKADIKEDIIQNSEYSPSQPAKRGFGATIEETYEKTVEQRSDKNIKEQMLYGKTDINNASEIELTALPGISIVISKKIIKRREEIGGFRTVDEFFAFLNQKPHIEKQLREIVYVTKMKGSVKIKRNSERVVDL